jgi:hypothetical protein
MKRSSNSRIDFWVRCIAGKQTTMMLSQWEHGGKKMFQFDQQISVMLRFRAMSAPVAVSVPCGVLFYLDTHAEREFAPDGTVIYTPPADFQLPRESRHSACAAYACAA